MNLIRDWVRMVMQEVIEAEASEVIGAERYERTPTRATERNADGFPRIMRTYVEPTDHYGEANVSRYRVDVVAAFRDEVPCSPSTRAWLSWALTTRARAGQRRHQC